MKLRCVAGLGLCLLFGGRVCVSQGAVAPNADRVAGITTLDVAPVWAGQPVGFALLTHGDQQYVAFYDSERRMTVAQRTLGKRAWRFTVLPSTVGWDSHNSIAMGMDRAGFLHVAGNMHASPLVYFRATRVEDAASLERVVAMTDAPEDQVTYPVFSHGPDGALLFEYRLGGSGHGDTFTNRYDEATRRWRALTGEPLFSGEGRRNAYPIQPVLGPDGWYHQVWVWRDTPDAETNHDLSYARSRDLVHWETAGGRPLKLPLTLETPGLIVDPVPVKGGIINNLQTVGFDAERRVIVAYTKYDAAGKTQLFLARWEGDAWHIAQASDWGYRWDFHGQGSLVFEIHLGSVEAGPVEAGPVEAGPVEAAGGALRIAVQHKVYGDGSWLIDPVTLRLRGLSGHVAGVVGLGASARMEAQTAGDSGGPRADGVRYGLRWETLPENRDQPRPGAPPGPAMLRLSVGF